MIECVNESQIQEVGKQLRQNLCIVELIENDANLHIIMEMVAGDQSSLVELIHTHTNVCRIEKMVKFYYLNNLTKMTLILR